MPLAALAAIALAAPAVAEPAQMAPLLAADRAWAASAARTNLVDGMAAMFDDEAVMVSGGLAGLVEGKAAIRARLAAKPENMTATVAWAPIGGGISADGTHGYTYGGLTVTPATGAPIAQKYLAYWVKRPAGWRVFVYKRSGRRESGALNAAPPVIGTGTRTDDGAASLKASEKAFSDEAQAIGLHAAFKKWGRADSINLGAAEAIAIGAEAIGDGVAGPEPGSPVTWGADRLLVAPSGDMGVTYGLLHAKAPPPGQPATLPFFTIWARPQPGDPWRYVAE